MYIQKNLFDYYNQVWIKIFNKDHDYEYHLKFRPEGIHVAHQQFNDCVQHWEHKYTTYNDIQYCFSCESTYNTIAVGTNNSTGSVKYAGAMAGQIVSLNHLKDIKLVQSKSLKPMYYERNAILTGSAGPHVITAQRKAIRVNDNWYRLLQWNNHESSGAINVRLDETGQVRQLIINSKHNGQQFNDHWKWIGNQHHKFLPIKNNNSLNRQFVNDNLFWVAHDTYIMLRTQGNGSISAAFRKTKANVRGLLFGDIITVEGPNDFKIKEINDPLLQTISTSTNQSIYHQMIDPMAA